MTGPWDDYRKGREHERCSWCYNEDRSKVGWSEKSEACWSKKRKDGSIIPLEERNRDHQIEKKNCVKVKGCNNQNDLSVYYDKIGDKCPANDKIADFGGMRWKRCTNCNPPHEHDSPKINLPPLNNEV